MAPLTTASHETTHAALLDTLDIGKIHKPFRNPSWKPPQRRNKTIKQILADQSRKEASVMATKDNSGASTPIPNGNGPSATHLQPAPPNEKLDRIALTNALAASSATSTSASTIASTNPRAQPSSSAPLVTYTSIEAAPSLRPKRKYCDVTGLPAKYTDPKTGLRYVNKEVFAYIGGMSQGQIEGLLGLRGANTVLK